MTGASSGIGGATARLLAGDHYGRNENALQSLAQEIAGRGGKVNVAVADVTVDEQVQPSLVAARSISLSTAQVFCILAPQEARGWKIWT